MQHEDAAAAVCEIPSQKRRSSRSTPMASRRSKMKSSAVADAEVPSDCRVFGTTSRKIVAHLNAVAFSSSQRLSRYWDSVRHPGADPGSAQRSHCRG